MKSADFVKHDLREETILRCPECLDEVEACSECLTFFYDDPVYCDQTGNIHLCEMCFNVLKDKEAIKV